MKTKTLAIVFSGMLCLMAAHSAMAQPGWNWPEDPPTREIANRKYALHSDQYKAKNYRESADALFWLLNNNPDLNSAIYIQGVNCYKALAKAEKDKARKVVLQDSCLTLYQMRMEYFPNDKAKVLDRLPYQAYRYYLRDKDRYAQIHGWFKDLYEVKGEKVGSHNLAAYFHLTTMHYTKPRCHH